MKYIAIALLAVCAVSCKKENKCVTCRTYISKVENGAQYSNAKPPKDTAFCDGNIDSLKADYIKNTDGAHSAWPQSYYYLYQTDCK